MRLGRVESSRQYSQIPTMDDDGVMMEDDCESGLLLPVCNESEQELHLVSAGTRKRDRVKSFLKQNLFIVLTVLSVVVGFAIGFGVRPLTPSAEAIMWIGFPGEIFLRLLIMIIVPLIITSVLSSTASLDAESNGKIGGLNVALVVGANTIGAVIGMSLALTFKPGRLLTQDNTPSKTVSSSLSTGDIIADLFRNVFPSNLVRATMQKTSTAYVTTAKLVYVNTTGDDATNQTVTERSRTLVYADSENILGLIFVCAVFGLATAAAGEKGKPFLDFFQSASEVIFIVLQWFFWLVPIGIASLIAASVAEIDDVRAVATKLGLFVAANVTGNAIIMLLLVPLAYSALTRTKPFRLMVLQCRVLIMVLGTLSSVAAIPEQFRLADKMKVDRQISTFAIPFNATLSRSGSAMFIALSAIFLAQTSNISLSATQVVMVCVLTAVCSLAIPAVASSSIVAIVIVCSTLGLPVKDVGLLFAVEWLLDRLRSIANNSAGVFIVQIISHYCTRSLDQENEEEHEEERLSEDAVPLMMDY